LTETARESDKETASETGSSWTRHHPSCHPWFQQTGYETVLQLSTK
jgi:hypothetical protein